MQSNLLVGLLFFIVVIVMNTLVVESLNRNASVSNQLYSTSPANQTPPDTLLNSNDVETVIRLEWHNVRTPFIIALWLLLSCIAKILFHVNKQFGEAIPDSALLIVVGLVLGFALKHLKVDENIFSLDAHTFFHYLLPPIIFDAGYFMPNRQLFENFDSVILFAVVGTIFNTLAIGFTLYGFSGLGLFISDFSLVQILLFASLISAVDPVAVIAVFEEVHVNAFLFVNVFGEALFNDGVAVVLYTMFKNIVDRPDGLEIIEFFYCFLSFFVISFGGILIGLFYAVLVSLATRFSSRVKIVAPVFIFVIPYLAYLSAEAFRMSSILAITTCGIVMKQYVKGNITGDASSSVKYFVKTLSQCSETVLFMFLGLSTMSKEHVWDYGFIGVTIVLCLFYRTIGVVVQCAVLNRFRKKKFSLVDEFVLAYGGLRGAIAFGLAISMPACIEAKPAFITACIAVIFFTVFVQGITIRPLVFWLKVERFDKERREKMIEKVYCRYCDFTMAGIEEIAGVRGPNSIRELFERFNATVLKPLLMRHERQKIFDASDILRTYKKIALEEAAQIVARLDREKKHNLIEDSPMPIWCAYNGCYGARQCFASNLPELEFSKPPLPEKQQQQIQEPQKQPQLDTDLLYRLFSELLDRKIGELNTMLRRNDQQLSRVHPERRQVVTREDDIKDNYMEIMGGADDAADSDSLMFSADEVAHKRDSENDGDEKNLVGRRIHSL